MMYNYVYVVFFLLYLILPEYGLPKRGHAEECISYDNKICVCYL